MFGNKRSVACPVAGCSSKWQKGAATEDASFRLRLERFFRIQASATATDDPDAVDLEEGENDDYTQI